MNNDCEKRPFMLALKQLERAWEGHMRKIAFDAGVQNSYRFVLLIVSREPGIPQKELAAKTKTTRAAISQTVKEMELTGYITKNQDEKDGRITRLFLTEKGKSAIAKMKSELEKSDALVTDTLGEKREAEMIRVFDELRELIGGLDENA